MDDVRKKAEELLAWVETEGSAGIDSTERYQTDTAIGISLKTPNADASVSVTFLELAVVEYRIVSAAGENVFYLHFELIDLDHAKELYLEMKECLLKQQSSSAKHIILCCSCGLTTSFFTMKLNDAAKALDSKMDFEAVPYERLYEKAGDKDAVLLAPQIGYQLKNVQAVMGNKIVMTIPVRIFSTYDGAAMITLLNETFEKKEETPVKKEQIGIDGMDLRSGSVLIVSVINMEKRNQIAYRVYDNGEIMAENQITKETYSFADIVDVIQLVTAMNEHLETICLVTPGMVINGRLTYEQAGIVDLDARDILQKKFKKNVMLFNDADMIALGYSQKQLGGGDTAFYFVPTGSHSGNIGLVINGGTIRGTKHMGGRQLDGVTNITTFPQNPWALMRTPEGNIELAARYLIGLYSYTGIRHIAFYSSMIPEAEALKKAMETQIPKAYLPDVVKVNSVRNYLYAGVLHCLESEADQ